MNTKSIWQFGAFIIGDELLSGKRNDKHFTFLRSALRQRGFELKWLQILPDEPDLLVEAFQWSLTRKHEGVFSFGGIGATPDDHTRQVVAQATGNPLEPHQEACQIIQTKFKKEAFPHRIKMADLPKGARLIPNPINQVPGFSIYQHHCLPGFPNMAHPMVEWILDTEYQAKHDETIETCLRVYTAESDLIPLMDQLLNLDPELKISSLPKAATQTTNRQMDLGIKGQLKAVQLAEQQATQYLNEQNYRWEKVDLQFH